LHLHGNELDGAASLKKIPWFEGAFTDSVQLNAIGPPLLFTKKACPMGIYLLPPFVPTVPLNVAYTSGLTELSAMYIVLFNPVFVHPVEAFQSTVEGYGLPTRFQPSLALLPEDV
jgi:hypothetical protein